MKFPQQWLVIGSVIVLLSFASGKSLRKRRQSDFLFPDAFDGLASRAGFPNAQNPFFQQRQRPGGFFPQQRPGGFFPQQPQLVNNNILPEVSTPPPNAMVTTPSPAYLNCIGNCPTTSEYNPICGTNRVLYFNQQKFDCALRCGAQVQVWRRGSCEGLFNMMRG